jgi:thioredoxin reductase
MKTFDVVVVGGGPTGLNAALILGRARRTVLVCDDGRPRNASAEQMHGFITREGTPPAEFLGIARRELEEYPNVDIVQAAVVRAERARSEFRVTLETGEKHIGKRLLLANGLRDKLPDIEGIASFWGRGVFVCPFCDGWEYRDRQIVVYGESGEAVGLAQELYGWTKHVTICNQNKSGRVSAKQRRWIDAAGCTVVDGPIQRAVGDGAGSLIALELKSGERVPCAALFLCVPLRQSCTIAADLGCKTDRAGSIVVDDRCRTNVPGCHAAGDAVTHIHQVILAAASGVRAAIAITTELLCDEAEALANRTSA